MKNWGYVITSLLIAALCLGMVQALYRVKPGQGGGGDVCPCGTAWIVTATFQMVISPTSIDGSPVGPTPTILSTTLPTSGPTLTPFIRSTPTKVSPLPTHTANPVDCPGYPLAAQRKGFEYRYLDRENSGIWQRIRVGPGTTYAIVGYLKPMLRKPVFWTFNGWESLSADCRQWIFNPLGELVDSWTQ